MKSSKTSSYTILGILYTIPMFGALPNQNSGNTLFMQMRGKTNAAPAQQAVNPIPAPTAMVPFSVRPTNELIDRDDWTIADAPTSGNSIIGSPFKFEPLQEAEQCNDFTPGIPGIGQQKGPMESSANYIARIIAVGQAHTLLTNKHLDPKFIDRINQASDENTCHLSEVCEAQRAAITVFLAQQRQDLDDFLTKQNEKHQTFFEQAFRKPFTEAVKKLSNNLSIATDLPIGRNTLGRPRITQQLETLRQLQKVKEESLAAFQGYRQSYLEKVRTATQRQLQEQASELIAEIEYLRQLRVITRNADTAPGQLAPISPRKTSASDTPASHS